MNNENITQKPENVPEKFWDNEVGSVRIESLLKSYQELEKKLGSMVSMPKVPEKAEDYSIEISHEKLEEDKEVNEMLHKAGFTPEQVQLVYDLAAEKLMPVIENIAAEYDTNNQIEKLVNHFGSKEKWEQVSRQLNAWGQKNLSENILEALSSSYEGVITLHKMMTSEEPSINGGSQPTDGL